ncbi:unnamed protein product [Caenorhabditis sp. 36 PRJEB53466]|nr:unnamed protein product [Caenorhabditis sp. 36 PRJEB53466]
MEEDTKIWKFILKRVTRDRLDNAENIDWREMKRVTGLQRSHTSLRHRYRNTLSKYLHLFRDLSKSKKVELYKALRIPVNFHFYKELQKTANVVLDDEKCLVHCTPKSAFTEEQQGGSMLMRVTAEQSEAMKATIIRHLLKLPREEAPREEVPEQPEKESEKEPAPQEEPEDTEPRDAHPGMRKFFDKLRVDIKEHSEQMAANIRASQLGSSDQVHNSSTVDRKAFHGTSEPRHHGSVGMKKCVAELREAAVRLNTSILDPVCQQIDELIENRPDQEVSEERLCLAFSAALDIVTPSIHIPK